MYNQNMNNEKNNEKSLETSDESITTVETATDTAATDSTAATDKAKTYKSFFFSRRSAWLVVCTLTLGALVFNLLRMFVFRVKVTLPDYEWSSTEEFNVKNFQTLSADKNGDITLLQITDLHLYNGTCSFDRKTFKLIEQLVKDSEPDLIVVTGDAIMTLNNVKIMKKASIFFDDLCAKYESKWCLVFGNHDAWGYGDKTALADVLSKSKYCMFQIGPTNLSSDGHTLTLGNYAINVVDSTGNYKCSLVMMDSNERGVTKEEGRYAPITPATIEWYEWFINGMTAANGGEVVPSLAFFHIPLAESKLMLADTEMGTEGFIEKVCSSDLNTGIYQKMVELGSTLAVFNGHDHQNSYQNYYDGGNVLLTNCVTCGYFAYGAKEYKGGRVIKLNVNQPELVFETYSIFAD